MAAEIKDQYENASQFLGGYFHQDFDCEFEDTSVVYLKFFEKRM
jgi:hypothetical protein